MLKKIFKWALISIASLLILAVIFYAVIHFSTQSRINKTYDVTLQKLSIPTDSSSYLAGKHIAQNRGCLGCHRDNLSGGRVFISESTPLGFIASANITNGKGGVQNKDEDWIRVLRHGLNKQNKSVWFMPSHEVAHLSNTEMAQLISYVKQQPAVDNTVPPHYIKPMGRILTFFNKFPLLPAEIIDHNARYVETMPTTVSANYGAYLTTTCHGCHGTNLKGAPAHSPQEPNIPNITKTGNPGKWSKDQFFTVLHSGKTPDGRQLTDAMPYKKFTYNDVELESIYLYLHQLK